MPSGDKRRNPFHPGRSRTGHSPAATPTTHEFGRPTRSGLSETHDLRIRGPPRLPRKPRLSRRRLLVVSGRSPWPPWRGDQLRTRQWVAALHQDYDVTVLTPPSLHPPDYRDWTGVQHETFQTTTAPARGARAFAAVLRGLPAQCGLYHYPDLGRRLRELSPDHDATVLLLARLALHTQEIGRTPWIADLVDALSLSFARRAAYDKPWLRPWWRLESHLLARAESRMMARATRTVVVSHRDANYLRTGLQAAERQLDVVPVALPTEPTNRSNASEATAEEALDQPPTLAFTGNLGYFVNREALRCWLLRVWPRLSSEHPELRLFVAGDRPPHSLQKLVQRCGGELIARPPDLRALLSRCTLAIAPLRAGAGMPLKILDAWAVGVPVVASTWAAAGVDAVPGRELLVADSIDQWIEAVGRLLEDPPLRRDITAAGTRALKTRFGREVVLEGLRGVVDQALSRPR